MAPPRHVPREYQAWLLNLHPLEDLVPGKTGLFDRTICLDVLGFLSPFFETLTAGRAAEEWLWPHGTQLYIATFARAATRLGLGHLRPCRYALRHGGASEDLLSRRRSHMEAKARGGWASDDSLRRYGKAAHLVNELNKVPTQTLDYGKLVLDNLSELLHLSMPTPSPPDHPQLRAPAAPGAAGARCRRK